MPSFEFHKYQGTGNDFIMIDDRAERFDPGDQERIARLCHRRFGIGADGLILIRRHAELDFEMIYFNSDGRLTTLCGNGGRCAVQFARHLGMIGKTTRFQTVQGPLDAFLRDGLVHLHMPDVQNVHEGPDHYFIDTGSPHHICFVDNAPQIDVAAEGRRIRYSEAYAPGGANVNFVQVLGDDAIYVRTYERGVEDETLSCGTGVTASALAYALKRGRSPVSIRTPGGELKIAFERAGGGKFTGIYLIGPAERVYGGMVDL
jgi:diaminopimelate epimerase